MALRHTDHLRRTPARGRGDAGEIHPRAGTCDLQIHAMPAGRALQIPPADPPARRIEDLEQRRARTLEKDFNSRGIPEWIGP